LEYKPECLTVANPGTGVRKSKIKEKIHIESVSAGNGFPVLKGNNHAILSIIMAWIPFITALILETS
jgi:hypothetical protein